MNMGVLEYMYTYYNDAECIRAYGDASIQIACMHLRSRREANEREENAGNTKTV